MYGAAHLGRRAEPDAAQLLCHTRVCAPVPPDLDVEVQRWGDEVDVFRYVLGKVVLAVAREVLFAVLRVLVDVVLCAK